MNQRIPLFKTYADEKDIAAVAKIIRRGTSWACGPEIEQFESRLAKFIGRKYALSFNSGTSALHSCLLAHDIKGGEVIVPSFTFIATANAVILAGGKPVFADIERQTYGLDATDVAYRITKKTKAIMPIHYGGCPARDIKELREISRKKNILLIEDAAQSLGARIGKKNVGTFGDSAMFSLCQNKVISTGEGGIIVTDSEKIYNKLMLIRSHGRFENNQDYFSATGEMDYLQIGYNFRMPTMLAALGLSQLNKIQANIVRRTRNADYLEKQLRCEKSITIPSPPKNYRHVHQMCTLQLHDPNLRNRLQQHLASKGVASKVYFDPIHKKKLYARMYGSGRCALPITEDLAARVLTIPMYPELDEKTMDYIVYSIRECITDEKPTPCKK